MRLTFDQRGSVVWTLVSHGGELSVLLNQQRSSTSQINLSHPVKDTQVKKVR